MQRYVRPFTILVLLLSIITTVGCGKKIGPSEIPVLTTDVFTGTIAPLGTSHHPFTVNYAVSNTDASLTLTSLTTVANWQRAGDHGWPRVRQSERGRLHESAELHENRRVGEPGTPDGRSALLRRLLLRANLRQPRQADGDRATELFADRQTLLTSSGSDVPKARAPGRGTLDDRGRVVGPSSGLRRTL